MNLEELRVWVFGTKFNGKTETAERQKFVQLAFDDALSARTVAVNNAAAFKKAAGRAYDDEMQRNGEVAMQHPIVLPAHYLTKDHSKYIRQQRRLLFATCVAAITAFFSVMNSASLAKAAAPILANLTGKTTVSAPQVKSVQLAQLQPFRQMSAGKWQKNIIPLNGTIKGLAVGNQAYTFDAANLKTYQDRTGTYLEVTDPDQRHVRVLRKDAKGNLAVSPPYLENQPATSHTELATIAQPGKSDSSLIGNVKRFVARQAALGTVASLLLQAPKISVQVRIFQPN